MRNYIKHQANTSSQQPINADLSKSLIRESMKSFFDNKNSFKLMKRGRKSRLRPQSTKDSLKLPNDKSMEINLKDASFERILRKKSAKDSQLLPIFG